MIKQHVFKVAGVSFEGRQEKIARLSSTAQWEIRAEPENQYDPRAQAVYADGVQIGFIPKVKVSEIWDDLQAAEKIEVSLYERTGGTPDFPTRGVTLHMALTLPGTESQSLFSRVAEHDPIADLDDEFSPSDEDDDPDDENGNIYDEDEF